MGWRDRIAEGTARASELAREGAERAREAGELAREKAAESESLQRLRERADESESLQRLREKAEEAESVQRVREGFQNLKTMLADDDEREFVVERALVALVRGVRDDDDERLTDRDLYKAAKRRSKRARRAALLAGPAAGSANQLVDLYCETATVCDLDRLHGLGLSDEKIAAHMLVLWNVTPELAVAQAALAGTGPSVSTMLTARFSEHASTLIPDTSDKKATIKALWNARGLANDLRERVVGERNISGVIFAGKRVKTFIARASLALGIHAL
jgi:hypothetical protein